MSAQQDFCLTVERACGLAMEATCSARNAANGPLPMPHRRLLNSAIRKLEGAQDDLFKARNDPWTPPRPPRHEQLELAA